jgi:hypothetical protein
MLFDNIDLGLNNSWYHAQPHLIIVYYYNIGQLPHITIYWHKYTIFKIHISKKIK